MDLNFCRTLCSLPRLLGFSHYLLGRFLPPCIHPCSCSCRKHASSNLHMLTPHFPQESAWIAPPLKGSLTNLQVSFSALAIYNYPTSCYIFIANFLTKVSLLRTRTWLVLPTAVSQVTKKNARHCSLVGPQLIKHMLNQRICTTQCYTAFKNKVAPDLPICKI